MIDLDDDLDNNDEDVDDDVVDVRFASTSAKRRRADKPQLDAEEQHELDELDNLRAAVYEKARQREQKRQASNAKLRNILDDPTSEQYLLLMSFLNDE